MVTYKNLSFVCFNLVKKQLILTRLVKIKIILK